ncbi:MAG TPA: hypothetical protein PLY40_03280 [Bacillota bacterium]|nr:hypothetical protein [Bacillota bacterium]
MKMMVVILLCLALLLPVGGCGLRKKVSEEISEKITEGILEQVAGENVDIDLEGESITIEGEEGEFTIGGSEWPKGKAADLIPRFDKGTITATMSTDEGCWITIEEVEEDDFNGYVEALKGAGFTENSQESSFGDQQRMYSAQAAGKGAVSVVYMLENKLMQINFEVAEE